MRAAVGDAVKEVTGKANNKSDLPWAVGSLLGEITLHAIWNYLTDNKQYSFCAMPG